MVKHTPTPWTAESENGIESADHRTGIAILEPDKQFWGPDYRLPDHSEMKANAEFIARACNAHYGLVEMLRLLEFSFAGACPVCGSVSSRGHREACTLGSTIAKAEQKP